MKVVKPDKPIVVKSRHYYLPLKKAKERKILFSCLPLDYRKKLQLGQSGILNLDGMHTRTDSQMVMDQIVQKNKASFFMIRQIFLVRQQVCKKSDELKDVFSQKKEGTFIARFMNTSTRPSVPCLSIFYLIYLLKIHSTSVDFF